MKRRTFMGSLLGGFGAGVLSRRGRARPLPRQLVIQESPLAGFEYHKGHHVWSFLREGDALRLIREATNPHDANAVAVYFRGDKLGYLPRRENVAVAQLLDRGHELDARIVRLRDESNPWRRIRFSVGLVA